MLDGALWLGAPGGLHLHPVPPVIPFPCSAVALVAANCLPATLLGLGDSKGHWLGLKCPLSVGAGLLPHRAGGTPGRVGSPAVNTLGSTFGGLHLALVVGVSILCTVTAVLALSADPHGVSQGVTDKAPCDLAVLVVDLPLMEEAAQDQALLEEQVGLVWTCQVNEEWPCHLSLLGAAEAHPQDLNLALQPLILVKYLCLGLLHVLAVQ